MISEQQEKVSFLRDLIGSLQQSTIQGSAITMCLLPNKNISEYTTFISSEINQASSIKDKNNRLSVIEGLKSIKQKLKEFKYIPQNGIIVIAANLMLPNQHVYEKVVEIIEPPRTITKEVYSCAKNFNFTYIHDQILVNNQTFGFIIIDGISALFATLQGNKKQILKEMKSDIMRNHNKGGQSALRFSRLREQGRFHFVKASCQQANKVFSGLNQNISGYIVAGSADLKNQFIQNSILSPQIRNKIIKVIDIAQSSQQGLKLAINQAKNILLDAQFLKEKQILQEFIQQMNINTKKVTNGYKTVVELISIGLVDKVICSKNLKKQEKDQLEQLCSDYGCSLFYVSNSCQNSVIFEKSYGGVGAILRYQFDSECLKQSLMQDEQTGIYRDEQFYI